jgi:hypothetical protein
MKLKDITMLDPKIKMFAIRGHLFCYKDGALHICTDGTWNRYESYPTYYDALESAEEIVHE